MTSLPDWVQNGSLDNKSLKTAVVSCSKNLKSSDPARQENGAKDLYALIMLVWSLDTRLARDAADIVCDEIRTSGGLESLIHLCSSTNTNLRLAILKAFEQIMVADNREFIACHKLFDSVVKVACSNESLEAIQAGTGILENLFKHSSETCLRLIHSGALEGLVLGCRSSDSLVLQHCAAALANCAMYGEAKAQTAMVTKYVDHWLFPLAFSKDSVVKYYALLAICFLAANQDIADKVAESATLELVLPFLNLQDTEKFTRSCPNHAHGRSSGWLKRLAPLLVSQSEEARSLVAFHFAMEAAIKKKQKRLNVFNEINAYEYLRKAAKHGSRLTAKFCIEALKTCDIRLPPYQCWNVINWSIEEVSAWVRDIGRGTLAQEFARHLVSGNILLDLKVDDIIEIGFPSRVSCRWFLGEIQKLRCLADVSKTGSKDVCKWLTDISKELTVYRVDFARKGISKSLLPHLTEDILVEIGVNKKLDRLRILLALNGNVEGSEGYDMPDQGLKPFALQSPSLKRKFDVFISYRRATGSQLASLLKVHLELRGLSVFLDVAELGSGKFDEAILTTIAHSNNLILVLSEASLDRCKGDTNVHDWLHKEVVCAMENTIHSVPVVEPSFHWPKEEELPEDIRQIVKWNAVSWSHEYQEACIEKLISFLKLSQTFRRFRRSRSRSRTRSILSVPSVVEQ